MICREQTKAARRSGLTLLEVMVVMTLLAIAAAMTWLPIAAGVRAASLRRFTAELAEYDAAERSAARTTQTLKSLRNAPVQAAELNYDADRGRLNYVAIGRSLSPPGGVRLAGLFRWHPAVGRWIETTQIDFGQSGQSFTYAVRMEPSPQRMDSLIVLGVSGQTVAVSDKPLPIWSAGG